MIIKFYTKEIEMNDELKCNIISLQIIENKRSTNKYWCEDAKINH